MKREIERTASLPIIEIDLAELSVLIEKLVAQFSDPAKASVTISVQIDNEKVSVKSVAELQSAHDLPARVAKFSISIWEDPAGPNRHVNVSSSPLASNTPRVAATGESEAWAAGAIETARVFFARHRRSLHWASGIPMGFIMFMATMVMIGTGLQAWKASHWIPWSWAAGYLAIFSLNLLYPRLAQCQLVLRDTENPLTRALPALGFVVALASLIVAILAWLLPRAP